MCSGPTGRGARSREGGTMTSLLPCPCCGSSDVKAGPASADSSRVRCFNCGLQVRVEVPNEWPPDLMLFKRADALLEMDRRAQAEAAARWNRRAGIDSSLAM